MKPIVVTAEDCYALRSTVLRPNQPKENWTFDTDSDKRALHMALQDDNDDIVAVVSILPETHVDCEGCPWRLRSMAVREDLHGDGLGSMLITAVLGKLNEGVWCTARKHVEGFYLKHGFNTVGKEFMMNNMPHVRMMKLFTPSQNDDA
ncbi:MAG: hypothetical protein CMJ38_03505 [Phycisphaerae bacterium]|nr:hypothetical protein [Phycisphaerae bacterium]